MAYLPAILVGLPSALQGQLDEDLQEDSNDVHLSWTYNVCPYYIDINFSYTMDRNIHDMRENSQLILKYS